MRGTTGFRRLLLMLLVAANCAAVGFINGATLYAAFVVEPHWTTSAAAIRQWWTTADPINGWDFLARFGMFISTSSIVILALGWFQSCPIKRWCIIYFAAITALGILSVLFLGPLEGQLISSVNTLADSPLEELVATWRHWNMVRCYTGIAALICLLRILSLTYYIGEKEV